MLRRRVPVALLSLSLWLTGCAAYELDERGYSNSRYPSYADQQFAYPDVRERYYQQQNNPPIIRYQQYPPPHNSRYRVQPQPVYYYRQVPQGYWSVPVWQGHQADQGYRQQRPHKHAKQRGHGIYDDRHEYIQQYQRGREQQGGWTLRIN